MCHYWEVSGILNIMNQVVPPLFQLIDSVSRWQTHSTSSHDRVKSRAWNRMRIHSNILIFARDIDAINFMSDAINCMSDLCTQILQLSHNSKWTDRLLGAFIKSHMNKQWSTETQIIVNITLIWIQFFCVSQIGVC